MKTSFTPQERDAFAKAVSAVEGINFIKEDDAFFEHVVKPDANPDAIMKRVLARALEKV